MSQLVKAVNKMLGKDKLRKGGSLEGSGKVYVGKNVDGHYLAFENNRKLRTDIRKRWMKDSYLKQFKIKNDSNGDDLFLFISLKSPKKSPKKGPKKSPKKSPKKGTKCEKGKIINPVSGRCVLRSGKIGKSIL